MNKQESLLLLSCCAPCACAVIAALAQEKRPFTVLFYNPNITPLTEYEKRRDEQKRLCEAYQVPFAEWPYDPSAWAEAVRGLEQEPERGARCARCFELRLSIAACYAKEHGFTHFTSVLGVSRYKDLAQVNAVALGVAQAQGVPYDITNWRKNGLEESRKKLIKNLHLYAQRYCGCLYSIRNTDEKNN